MDCNGSSSRISCDVIKYKYPQGFQDEIVIASIVYQTLQGLNFLHEKHMIHRDIKAGNILFNEEGQIKIADFGVSAILASHDQRCSTLVGTFHWMAPEVIDPTIASGYDFLADIWSLGITCIELAYGKVPYSQHRPASVFVYILKNEPPSLQDPRLESPTRTFSPTFIEFVSRCLEKDPSLRLAASRLLGHRFFRTMLSAERMREILSGLPSLQERFKQQETKVKQNFEDKVKPGVKLSARLLNPNNNNNNSHSSLNPH